MPTFTYSPDYGAGKTITPTVKKAQFGDGYAQRLAFGINTQPQIWDVTFSNRDDTEGDAIEEFLIDLAGVDYFDWTPPNESTERKFICSEWKRSREKPNLSTITAQFTEVFDP